MDDRTQASLLRAHEPVLRFHRGERFFPMDVASFVEGASLWRRSGRRASERIRPAGSLTLDDLGAVPETGPGEVLFLRHATPMAAADLARRAFEEQQTRGRDPRDIFRAGRGRLARAGYLPRLVDAAFSLSLLARGRVPGDLAAAAAVAYRSRMREAEDYRYYGRVVQCGDWTVLQYWYFYFFNDWRSHFFGTNDHEGDWETVSVFLGPDGSGGRRPEWVATSCHEYPGVELRRHWEDPELETRDGHPVVHVAAGSHAGYFRSGDYLADIEIPAFARISRLGRRVATVWRDTLRQYAGDSAARDDTAPAADFALRVPFVDYARGDGHAIGAGEERTWSEPVVITSPPSWVRDYRGLWGYYARDPFLGEDAPPGPMYDRDGSVRLAWQDPVTWCRLGTTPPREQLPEVTSRVREELRESRERRSERIAGLREELAAIGVGTRLAEAGQDSGMRSRELRDRGEQLRAELARELAVLSEEADALRRLPAGGPAEGIEPRMRAHLRRARRPISDERLRADRLAEVWAALSVGLLLLAMVAAAVVAPEQLARTAVVLLAWAVVIEAFLRKGITQLVSFVAVVLAVVGAGVLLVEFHRPVAIALAFGTGAFLLWENVRELWS